MAYRNIEIATLNFFRTLLPGSAFISNFALANLSYKAEYKAMNHRLLLMIAISLLSLNAWSQSKITMKGNWMYTDVTLSGGGSSHNVPGLIDTGCSVCIIDSTYAVDSCHIKDLTGDKMMDNTAGQSIKTSYVYLDSISFASSTYTHVWCFIVDLAGKLKQFAPKFIIGGDILKRDSWCFDMKTYKLQRINELPTNVATSLAWKQHADDGLNMIVFKGKIAGKKTRTLFDTGSRFNELLHMSELTPTSYVELPSADIANGLTYKKTAQCKNIPVEIADCHFEVDFNKETKGGSDYPRLNASFLMGKRWVLDYTHKQLLVLSE
jgi:hypothetical protein